MIAPLVALASVLTPPVPQSAVAYPAPVKTDLSQKVVVGVALGDLDLDGIDDLVYVTSPAPIELGARLGLADGTFGPQMVTSVYPTSAPVGLELADVTNDGLLDALVTVGNVGGTGGLFVLPGTGTTVFAPPAAFASGSGVSKPNASDITGDGLLDIAISCYWSNAVRLYENTGPSFVELPAIAQLRPTLPSFGDLDGDGSVDVVMTTAGDAAVTIRRGDGAGGYSPASTVPVPQGVPRRALFAALSADGTPDVVAPLLDDDGLVVAQGLPGGALGPFVLAPTIGEIQDAATADVNADGALDVLAFAAGGPNVLLGDGAGGFAHATAYEGVFGGLSVVGTLGGDTHPDIVTIDPSKGIYAILSGDGDGGLAAARAYPTAADVEDLVLGDLDGDGAPDLVVAPTNGEVVVVHRGDGAGGFGAPVDYPGAYRPTTLSLARVDADAATDLLVATWDLSGAGRLAVLRGDGLGGFGAPSFHDVGKAPIGLASPDLDGDGRADAVLTSLFEDTVAVLLGDGAGGFAPAAFHPTDDRPRGVAAGDLDADGDLDLAIAIESGWVALHSGSGTGGLAPPMLFPVPPTPERLIVADLDADGLPDVALTTSNHVQILKGLGGLGLAPAQSYFAEYGAAGLRIADLDGDARLDFVVTQEFATDTIAVGLGDGLGGFGAPARYISGGIPRGIEVADLDADGRQDVVVATLNGTFGVLLQAQAAPTGITSYGTGTPGCLGTLGINATSAAQVGNQDFRLITSNAPPESLGWFAVALAADTVGSDSLGLGAVLHLDLFASTLVLVFAVQSDPVGGAVLPLGVPALPSLAGATVFAQSLWVVPPDAACWSGALQFASSLGLQILIQP